MSNAHGNSVAAGTTLVTTAETVAAVITPAVAVNAPSGEGVALSGSIALNTGTAATSVNVRIRQGATAAGTQVGQTLGAPVSASSPALVPFDVVDTSAFALSGPADQWCVTVQQVAATGNGSIVQATITAESVNVVE
jgi:predicted flavoprotein YhiN